MSMLCLYRIDSFNFERREVELTCYLDTPENGIAVTTSFSDTDSPYPEGAALDRFIRSRLPGNLETKLREKRATVSPTNSHLSTKAHAHFVTSLGGMTHILDGDEKIYQLRPLNRIRRFEIPLEIY